MERSFLAEREFVLSHQANLILKDFMRYYLREGKRAFFFIPKLEYATFDSNGCTITRKTFVSDRYSFSPSMTELPSWNNYDIVDRYYGEIISQHCLLDGETSKYHQKYITYVKVEDQRLLCDLISQKLYENHIQGVKVCFDRAIEKKFIFKKDLGYSYLCLSCYK